MEQEENQELSEGEAPDPEARTFKAQGAQISEREGHGRVRVVRDGQHPLS